MSHLAIDHLTKSFNGHLAVDDISFEVAKGEFVSILGPSGCGKTTTLQMIAGFVEPTAGHIRLDGRDLSGVPEHRRGLGIVFQAYALFPHMTAAENIAFGLKMRKVGRAERDARVSEALALVGLSRVADQYPARLSGGQQQRVALARALVIRPPLLLLDEPLSSLDAKMREEMQSELRRIQSSIGTTTIMVTHDQAEALALSDRVIVMNNGRVEQVASPVEAYDRPATRFVANFLGRASEIGPDRLAIRPERLRFGSPTNDCMEGLVVSRTFHGTHWLCEVRTAGGDALVLRPHDGSDIPAEGATVHLHWGVDDALPASAGGSEG